MNEIISIKAYLKNKQHIYLNYSAACGYTCLRLNFNNSMFFQTEDFEEANFIFSKWFDELFNLPDEAT